jgi:hypothetical protein
MAFANSAPSESVISSSGCYRLLLTRRVGMSESPRSSREKSKTRQPGCKSRQDRSALHGQKVKNERGLEQMAMRGGSLTVFRMRLVT